MYKKYFLKSFVKIKFEQIKSSIGICQVIMCAYSFSAF